ncbi:MAG: hypothetical protein QNJ54_31100 [Prochloraceae cyanobacterium]|nr:hypothetical protein [Prochloraceae cyanobacterium]
MSSSDNLVNGNDSYNFFLSLDILRDAHVELLKKYQGNVLASIDEVNEVRNFICKGQETGVLLETDKERRQAQTLLDYWGSKLLRDGYELPDTILAEFDPSRAPELPDTFCPYVGINAFESNARKLFFGRNRFIDSLIEHLREKNLLVIVGSSGSGRSSVVFCELIPRLKEGALPGGGYCHIYERMLPGTNPLANLEKTLKSSAPENQNVTKVLIIDHFEEIFTLCHENQIRQQFINKLQELLQNSSNFVILIMQEEQRSQIARLESFVSDFERAEISMPLLELNDLREMIEGPAKSIGLKLEGGLVDALLTDLVGDPIALPLLQFTMLKLWEKRDRNRITLAIYEELGRAHKAIANSAEDFYKGLSPHEQDIAKYILLRMIQPTEEFGCKTEPILVKTLYREGEPQSLIKQVLYELICAKLVRQIKSVPFVDRKLIEIADDDQVEIAYKALALRWELMRTWLQQQWITNNQVKQLDKFVQRWEKCGRNPQALLREVSLTDTLRYIDDKDLTEREIEFVKESRKFNQEEQKEKERLKFRSIIQALVAHARLQQERYRENQRGALLAYQAYIFNKRYRNFSDAYLGALLSEILNVSYFSRVLLGHEKDVPTIAFSPDGKTLALGSSDGTILLWDIPSECLRKTLDSQKYSIEIKSLVFHPKNSQFLVLGNSDGTVQLWDLSQPVPNPLNLYRHEGYPVPENNRPEVWALDFNSDGTILASGSWDCTIRLWDFQQQKPLRFLEGHKDFIWSIAFSPDGKTLASGSRDGTVLLWDLNQFDSKPQRLSVHKEEINHNYEVFSVAFSPDGTMLASGCRDHFVRLWTFRTYDDKLIAPDKPVELERHHKEVRSVAFHPDPDTKLLASGSGDQTVRLWYLRFLTSNSFPSPCILNCHDTGVSSVAFSSNGEFLAASCWNQKLELWDLRRPVNVLQGKSRIFSVTISSDAEWVVWGDEAGNIKGWKQDLVDHHPIILEKHEKTVRSVAFHPNKQILASGSLDGTVQLWQFNQQNGQLIYLDLDLGYCEQGFQSVTFSKDGQWLAAGDRNQTVWVWNLGEPGSAPFTKHLPFPHSIPCDQREIKWIWAVAFSPDSQMLASGHGDGIVQLWHVSQHSIEPKTLDDRNRHRQEVRAVAFSPCGRWLASASADRIVRLWDLRSEKSLILYGANSGFNSIAFSPEGALLAVGCFDGTIWVWDVDRPYAVPIVLPRRHYAGVSSVSFSPNGQKLISGSHDGTVLIWNMNAESLAKLICERVQRNLTQDEWARFVDFGIDYLRTCPNLPPGNGSPPNAQSSEDWLNKALPLTDFY